MDFDAKSAVDSYLGWWSDAGLIDPVSDSQRGWLTAADLSAPAPGPVAAVPLRPPVNQSTGRNNAQVAAADILPDTLTALDAWFASHAAVLCPEGGARQVLPVGPDTPQVMVLSDMPDEEDVASGHLFSGARGDLLAAMLRAIDIDPARQRLASILLSRPLSRQLPDDVRHRLLRIANHHISVVRPDILLLLGPQACQLITGIDAVPAPEDQPFFNHGGVKTAVFATHKLRLLIDRPQYKRHAWEVLKRMKDKL